MCFFFIVILDKTFKMAENTAIRSDLVNETYL